MKYIKPIMLNFTYIRDAPIKPIPTIFDKSGDRANAISFVSFHFDQSMGIGMAGTRIYHVSIGKLGRPKRCA